MNEQRFIKILLNDRCSIAVFRRQLLYDVPNFTKAVCYLDSCSSVRIFTWLDNPNICVFLLLKLFVSTSEPIVFGITSMRSLDVESQWNGDFEWIDSHRSVVCAHIQEQSFFV